MEENVVLHEKLPFLPWSHATGYTSVAVINMSAACRIPTVLHIAEVEVFSSSFEGQDLCYMVCLSLRVSWKGNGEMRLSPCILLWVHIPLKYTWLFLGTGVCFSCMNQKEQTGLLLSCFLFVDGVVLFPFWRNVSYFKAPIFQLINLSDSGQNPLWSIIV